MSSSSDGDGGAVENAHPPPANPGPKGPTRVIPGPLKDPAWTTLPSYVTAQAISEGPWGLWLTQKNGANSAYGKIRSHLLVPLDSYLCLFSMFYSFYLFFVVDRKFTHSLPARGAFIPLDRSKGTGFSPFHFQNQLSQRL